MIDELIKHTKAYQELSYLAEAAEKEIAELREKISELEKELGGDHYVPQEYPKMLADGRIVNSADEEYPDSVKQVDAPQEAAQSETEEAEGYHGI